MSDLGAILLAGGRGSRMGGIAKPLLEVGGATLLDKAITAARDAGCEPIVGVGDTPAASDAPAITWVREDPPFGGPAAAILAALPHMSAPRTLVLACDLPWVEAAVRLLCDSPFQGDGMCMTDAGGRTQWLIGIYRTDALRAAAALLPHGGQNAPVHALLAGLEITSVAASDALAGDIAFDIDTWDDLFEARRSTP